MSELDGFARFCERNLTAEDGAPFVLEPFQRTILADYFAGVSETVALLPKKNGKSSLFSALAIFHVLTVPFAECAIVAASRDQAGTLLRQAQGFIRRSPALRTRLRVKQREITNDSLGGRIRVLASDVDTFDGWLGTLGLVDELHRHRSPELYGLIREGIGPRGGQMAAISSAGDDEGSPLGRLRAAALALPGVKRDGAHSYVSTEHLAFHEWALDPDADIDDFDLVLTANPASWIDRGELERRRTASMRDWQWRRFTCGIWVHGEDAAISDKEWRLCAAEDVGPPPGAPGVYAGLDLGWKHDYTAFVPLYRPEGSEAVEVGKPTILKPPGDGTSLDAEEIFAVIEEAADRWPELTLVLDPEAGGEQLAQRIEAELGVSVIAHSQRHGPMCTAAARLSEAIATGRLRHPDDPELNRHVLAASAKQVGEAFRFAKPRGAEVKIDALIALAMAHSLLVTPPEPKVRPFVEVFGADDEPTRSPWGDDFRAWQPG